MRLSSLSRGANLFRGFLYLAAMVSDLLLGLWAPVPASDALAHVRLLGFVSGCMAAWMFRLAVHHFAAAVRDDPTEGA